MSWQSPQPTPQSQDREKLNFSREIWTRVKFANVTWTPAAVPSYFAMDTLFYDGSPDVSTKVTGGLRVGMEVKVNPPSGLPAGLVVDGFCFINDQLTIRISNFSGGALMAPAGSWAFCGVVI